MSSNEAQLGLDTPDGEVKIADTSDEPDGKMEDVYTCQHPSRPGTPPPGGEIGVAAGADCALYALGGKRELPPHLALMLARVDTLIDEPPERVDRGHRLNADGSVTYWRDSKGDA